MGNKAYNKIKKKAEELKERVQSETPEHFSNSIKLGLTAFGVGLTLRVTMLFVPVLQPLEFLSEQLITGGLATAGISKTAKK